MPGRKVRSLLYTSPYSTSNSYDLDPMADPPSELPPSQSFSCPLDNSPNALSSGSLTESDLDAAASNLQESVWAGRTRSYQRPTVEDAEEDADLEEPEQGSGGPELSLEDQEVWERLHAEGREAAEYEAISVWDELAESFLREGVIRGASDFFTLDSWSLTLR